MNDLDQMLDRTGHWLDPRDLGNEMVVAFPVVRLPQSRVVWLNHRWLRENGVDGGSERLLNRFSADLLDRFGVLADGVSVEEASQPVRWLEADRYGGTAGARHGGSGRIGSYQRLNAKGIGRTPLVSNKVDPEHSNGLLPFREAVREAIFAEICNARLPYGALPIIAIIDTGLWHSFDKAKIPERCAIVVRPTFIRPAHYERTIFYGDAGHPGSAQVLDAARVERAVQRSLEQPERYPTIRETFTRHAVQLGACRAHRLWMGKWLSSNVSVDGQLADFGSFRTVPTWHRRVGMSGETFGSELDQLKRAFLSVLYYVTKSGGESAERFDVREFVAALTLLEHRSFVGTCLDSLGANTPIERSALEKPIRLLYDNQQTLRTGDDVSDAFWLHGLLSGHSLRKTTHQEETVSRDLLKTVETFEQSGSTVTVSALSTFLEPRDRFQYVPFDKALTALLEQYEQEKEKSLMLRRCITNILTDYR